MFLKQLMICSHVFSHAVLVYNECFGGYQPLDQIRLATRPDFILWILRCFLPLDILIVLYYLLFSPYNVIH